MTLPGRRDGGPPGGWLRELRDLLVQRTGLWVTDRDLARLVEATQACARAGGAAGPGELVARLAAAPGASGPDWARLVDRMTVSESYFNRDHAQLALIEQEVLPRLLRRRDATRRLRLWSAGCATGEEPYSLAIIAQRLLESWPGWDVHILATDISRTALARAQRGVFSEWSFRRLPEPERARWFTRVHGGWEIDGRLRRMVTFRYGNLVADAAPDEAGPATDMDLIVCRNVLIYFDQPTTATVAARLAAALAPDGFLVTGHTELIGVQVPGLGVRQFPGGTVRQRVAAADADPGPHTGPPTVDRRPRRPSANLPAGPRPVSQGRASARVRPRGGGPASSVPAGAAGATADQGTAAAQPQEIARDAFSETMGRGYRCADEGDLHRAREAAIRAAQIDEFAADPYLLLATVAELAGDPAAARRALTQALYLDPLCLPACQTLAALYEADGRHDRARALQERARDLMDGAIA